MGVLSHAFNLALRSKKQVNVIQSEASLVHEMSSDYPEIDKWTSPSTPQNTNQPKKQKRVVLKFL